MFVSNSHPGNCLLGLPYLCDIEVTLELSPVSQFLVFECADLCPVTFQLAFEDSDSWYRSLVEGNGATLVTAVLASVGVDPPVPVVRFGFVCEVIWYTSKESMGFHQKNFC